MDIAAPWAAEWLFWFPRYVFNSIAAIGKTITFPVAADINTQFGGGKSAMYPVITIINQNATYNLSIAKWINGCL